MRRRAEGYLSRNCSREIFIGHGLQPVGDMLFQRVTCIDLMSGNTDIHRSFSFPPAIPWRMAVSFRPPGPIPSKGGCSPPLSRLPAVHFLRHSQNGKTSWRERVFQNV